MVATGIQLIPDDKLVGECWHRSVPTAASWHRCTAAPLRRCNSCTGFVMLHPMRVARHLHVAMTLHVASRCAAPAAKCGDSARRRRPAALGASNGADRDWAAHGVSDAAGTRRPSGGGCWSACARSSPPVGACSSSRCVRGLFGRTLVWALTTREHSRCTREGVRVGSNAVHARGAHGCSRGTGGY